MVIYIIKSKVNKDKKNLSGFVWAHGGGAVFGDALQDNASILINRVLDNDLVCVNVNYRLAPEHKSPAGA